MSVSSSVLAKQPSSGAGTTFAAVTAWFTLRGLNNGALRFSQWPDLLQLQMVGYSLIAGSCAHQAERSELVLATCCPRHGTKQGTEFTAQGNGWSIRPKGDKGREQSSMWLQAGGKEVRRRKPCLDYRQGWPRAGRRRKNISTQKGHENIRKPSGCQTSSLSIPPMQNPRDIC